MDSKPAKIIGWVLSIAVFSLLTFASARAKLTQPEEALTAFEQIGYAAETMYRIGILEVTIAVLFLLPRVNFIGALLLTAYLGGATASHVRIDDAFIAPMIVCTVAWIGLVLRRPELLGVITGASGSANSESD